MKKAQYSIFAGLVMILPLASQSAEIVSSAVQDSLIADINSACITFTEHHAAAVEGLRASGWAIEDEPTEKPNFTDVYGTRDYEGVGTADFYLMTENYPAHQLNFCSITIMFSDALFDIERIGTTDGFIGGVQSVEDGAFGSWQNTSASALQLLQAYQNGSDFHYQLTELQKSSE